MSDEKEPYIGPVEQEINSMMGTAGNEIMDHTQRGAGTKEGETVQNIHIVNLSRCIVYLAKEIDKLAQDKEDLVSRFAQNKL
ncbi:MAG: hypothetical protein Q8N27_05285 [Candidatus Hydromicrobium sp.]|nr:hypothetical protein [Candidatus Hydromicrobium sp.]